MAAQHLMLLLAACASISHSKPATSNVPASDQETTMELRMPGVQPQVADTYLCLPTKVEDQTIYIDEFDPHANMSTAHHMLLYGCEEPGDEKQVWNCGEMASRSGQFAKGPVCQTGSQILYAWAMDAPKFRLPADVAFKVGASTNIKWLVLQVHYKDVTAFTPPNNGADNSGITLHVSSTPRQKTAGMYLLGTRGEVAPHSTVYMEAACVYEEPTVLHPFAYRVHTHTHGQVVSGYRVRDGEWEEIGRMSPKRPQMFYNITHQDMDVKQNDIMAARCTMVNNGSETVEVGATQQDEMCNFYVMYWVEGDTLPQEEYCFSAGPPTWNWNQLPEINVDNAPIDVSQVPGGVSLEENISQFPGGASVEESAMSSSEVDPNNVNELYDLLSAEVANALYNEALYGDMVEADRDDNRDMFAYDLWDIPRSGGVNYDSEYNPYAHVSQQEQEGVLDPSLDLREKLQEYYPPMYENLVQKLQDRLKW